MKANPSCCSKSLIYSPTLLKGFILDNLTLHMENFMATLYFLYTPYDGNADSITHKIILCLRKHKNLGTERYINWIWSYWCIWCGYNEMYKTYLSNTIFWHEEETFGVSRCFDNFCHCLDITILKVNVLSLLMSPALWFLIAYIILSFMKIIEKYAHKNIQCRLKEG